MSQNVQEIEKLKYAPAIPGVLDVILKRWSPRAFTHQPVSEDHLRQIFEAARWAASSYNEQPWRFLFGKHEDATYTKILDTMVEFNRSWAKNAPVLILSVARRHFSHNGHANQYALHDTGAATAYLHLQATALGLHAHSMAGFDHNKARAAFGIGEGFEIGAVTVLGHLGDPNSLPDPMREQELAPRPRKPLAEIVFSEWEVPAKI